MAAPRPPARPTPTRTAELPPRVLAAMNEQVGNELRSWYQYLAMSAYLEEARMPGAAGWMRAQAAEEMAHAMKFYNFIVDRNGRVDLRPIPAPQPGFGSPAEVFETALRNEQEVTSSIIALHELAVEERDYVTHALLQEFLVEQMEEEKTAGRLVDMFRLAGSDGPALLTIDRELASRRAGEE